MAQSGERPASRRRPPEAIAAAAACLARGRPRRDADRDGLRPRGRRDLGSRRSRRSTPPRSGRRSTRSSPMSSTSRRRASRRVFGPEAERLARAFWPGPLTLVLPAAPVCRVSLLARAGLDTRGAARAGARDGARADRGGGRSARRALRQPLGPGEPDDRRSCRSPISTAGSTGSSTAARAAMASNRRSSRSVAGRPRTCCVRERSRARRSKPRSARRSTSAGGSRTAPNAPGQLASHYAPRAELRLGAAEARADEAALDFGGVLGGERGRRAARSFAGRRPRRGGVASVRLSAGARRGRRGAGSRSRRSPNMGSGRRSTTGSGGRPRRAQDDARAAD